MTGQELRSNPGPWLDLTTAQRFIWTSQQLRDDVALFNMAFLFQIDGAVSEGDFAQAFDLLVRQCDALRIVVGEIDGHVRQRVLPAVDFELPIIDLSDAADPFDAARAWADERCRSSLNPAERLFDAALLRLGPRHSAWYLNQHHLVTDAWSSAAIFERMATLYRVVRTGGALPDPMPAFADYIERERSSASRTTELPERPRLASAPPLSSDRATTGSTESVRVAHAFTAQQQQRFDDLRSRPEFRAITPDLGTFRLMATALFAYLSRVSGASAVTIGAPVHNRPTADLRRAAGLFMEILPLAVEIDDDETFLSLHAKVVQASDALMRTAAPGASTSAAHRSINTVLNVIRGDVGEFDGAPVTATWLHPGHGDPHHHLRVHVHDLNATGRLQLLFDCRVMSGDETTAHVPHHVLSVLQALLDDPNQRIAAVDLLDDDERARVLAAVNATPSSGQAGLDVVSRFREWATTDPHAVALVAGDRRWTYSELDEASRRIAAGIAAGSVVGVCLPRSAEAVVGMLGVLRAGAAYVPIDPGWPTDRIDDIVAQAECASVIAAESRPLPVEVVRFDDLARRPPVPDGPMPAADQVAYVLFTSGSTGRPKGVVIEHGALAGYVEWASGFYDAGQRLVFPLFTPLTFDLTVTSIFVPLASGGSIVVYPESGGPGDVTVRRVFDDDLVDIVKLTPSHLALLTDRDSTRSRIRQLVIGGEDLSTAVAARIDDLFDGDVVIHNEYGPTEATVGCIVHTFDRSVDQAASVPIGRPIDGMRAYVLDAGGNPVPFGMAGELWVGGRGLARGYLGAPDLTAARFRSNATVGEHRLYATGDLARIRPTGTIEYLGRNDDQVKIRGARVELGEVQAALAQHPGITAAAARVWDRATRPAADDVVHCALCGLASDYPGVSYDAQRVCNHCRSFDTYRDRAQVYFKSMPELEAVFADTTVESDYDCISLLSGGKDSTYVLCRLVDMGLRVLAFTLDNGYISDEAKSNIRRVVAELGIDHMFASTPAMNDIFVDSLQRHANVCNGCFKTIYTLSLQTARERRIPFIVTGLSRGQFFETRLTEEIFMQASGVSAEQIEADTLATRKVYHQVDDAAHRLLDTSIFEDDQIFDDVKFVDFYRYCDVGLDELYAYLRQRVPWVRPRDTGRSTNCRINDVGIYYHQRTRGFHNYSLPYSWDVRMGHKTREAAIEELDDDIDVDEVHRILREIGFPEDPTELETGRRLVAYYVARTDLSTSELRAHMRQLVPDQMVPAQFVRLDSLPMTANGKIDHDALPTPDTARPVVDTAYLAPHSDVEIELSRIWEDVLGVVGIGVRDSFFDLGGDSILAIRIVARAQRAGLPITLAQLFEAMTVESLARLVGTAVAPPSVDDHSRADTEPFALADLQASELEQLKDLFDER